MGRRSFIKYYRSQIIMFQAFADFFSAGVHAEYKSKGIIVQVSECNVTCLNDCTPGIGLSLI